MKSIFLALLFLAVGCGEISKITGMNATDHGIYQKPVDFKPTGTVDTEMKGYLTEYNAEAAKRGVKAAFSKIVEVNWVPDLKSGDETLWGLCQTYFNPDNTVVSSVTLSDHLNTDVPACVKKLIIFHEFSHGLLGVKHTAHDPSNVLEIMFWSSGAEQIANCDETGAGYLDWDGYLDFMFKNQQLEQVD